MEFFNFGLLIDFVTLSGLEIILGVDNVIFIALLVQNLDSHVRKKAMLLGLSIALVLRIILLFTASWVISLTKPLFDFSYFSFSAKDLLLLIGGLFLIYKASSELIASFTNKNHHNQNDSNPSSKVFFDIIIQIIFVDLVLSFDSIITAVGICNNLYIIIAAIILSMIIMIISSKKVNHFLDQNPQIKIIALYFIALVGVFIFCHGLQYEINKGYLYFAIFFALIIEVTRIKLEKSNK